MFDIAYHLYCDAFDHLVQGNLDDSLIPMSVVTKQSKRSLFN